jgi:hypothetical protein
MGIGGTMPSNKATAAGIHGGAIGRSTGDVAAIQNGIEGRLLQHRSNESYKVKARTPD